MDQQFNATDYPINHLENYRGKAKERIAEHLLNAMNSIDQANSFMPILNTKTDLANHQKLFGLKLQIQDILNADYDACARRRN